MITSAENQRWPEDVAVTDLDAAGLPKASVVRPAKIACNSSDRVIRRAGALERDVREAVRSRIVGVLTFESA